MGARVLVVDDKFDMAETLAEALGDHGYEAVACGSSTQAVGQLETHPFDALVTDLRMPDMDGIGLLARSRELSVERPVIVMTAYGAVESAVEAIQKGAYQYLTKPFALSELMRYLRRALEPMRERMEAQRLSGALSAEVCVFGSLVTVHASVRGVFEMARRVARASTPILIVGETGTGKTALARAIHDAGDRRGKPFFAVNCASLPDALLESELFGHVRGAFTGALSSRTGLFTEADGGTLLLDEVGEMSPALQAKLLDVVESGAVRPLGSNKERAVDVRILAATHRDLRQRTLDGAFRQDLLYRLDVVTIDIPALRFRRKDIPVLTERFLVAARSKHPQSPVERMAPNAMSSLMEYSWPGNVRELSHAIERSVLLGHDVEGAAADLPPSVQAARPCTESHFLTGQVLPIREVQRRYATWALARLDGRKTRTAQMLGVDMKTLGRWLRGQ